MVTPTGLRVFAVEWLRSVKSNSRPTFRVLFRPQRFNDLRGRGDACTDPPGLKRIAPTSIQGEAGATFKYSRELSERTANSTRDKAAGDSGTHDGDCPESVKAIDANL